MLSSTLWSQQDTRAHGTEHSRLTGRQTVQPTFASAQSSHFSASHIAGQPLVYHDESGWEFHTAESSRLPNFPSGIATLMAAATPLATITAPGVSQHTPAADVPQIPQSSIQQNQPRRRQNSQHPQYTAAEWNIHRQRIKELYIGQNKSLKATMQIMKTEFDDLPNCWRSKKMYKDKINDWELSKNLPKKEALWMLKKAEQRKRQRPEAKIIFVRKEREWTEEGLRTRLKGAKLGEDDLDEATPQGITYKTPGPINVPSPGSARTPKEPGVPTERWTPAPFPTKPQLQYLRLSWNGQTLEALNAIRQKARELDREGDVQNAETKLREVLAGFEHLLSPTHEDTNAVAYELATFYAGHDRMNDADLVLNWMGEKHVERWGLDHQKTMAHFLHVADLFNSWGRNDDATTFLYRVLDALDEYDSTGGRDGTTPGSGPPRTAQTHFGLPQASRQSEPGDMARAFAETDDPVRVDYQLSLARARVAANGDATESLLLCLIEQCEKYPEKLSSQILQARCTLLDFYQRLGDHERVASGLDQAQKALEKALASTKKKTRSLLEACVKVAELHVQNDYCQSAEDMFQTIGCDAEDTFGVDHEDTIGILISIGKIYQREKQWANARPWFERALAASMTSNGLQSTMTRRLEAALENQCYSVTALTHEELESIVRSSSLHIPGVSEEDM